MVNYDWGLRLVVIFFVFYIWNVNIIFDFKGNFLFVYIILLNKMKFNSVCDFLIFRSDDDVVNVICIYKKNFVLFYGIYIC